MSRAFQDSLNTATSYLYIAYRKGRSRRRRRRKRRRKGWSMKTKAEIHALVYIQTNI